MSILYWVLGGLAGLWAYIQIGRALGKFSLRVWEKKKRSFWSLLLFPISFARNRVGEFFKEQDLPPLHVRYYLDEKNTYLAIISVVWPLKIIQNLLSGIIAVIYAVVIFRPIQVAARLFYATEKLLPSMHALKNLLRLRRKASNGAPQALPSSELRTLRKELQKVLDEEKRLAAQKSGLQSRVFVLESELAGSYREPPKELSEQEVEMINVRADTGSRVQS